MVIPDALMVYSLVGRYWESAELGVNANWSSDCSDVVCNASDSAKAWTNADKFDPPWGCGAENYTQVFSWTMLLSKKSIKKSVISLLSWHLAFDQCSDDVPTVCLLCLCLFLRVCVSVSVDMMGGFALTTLEKPNP